MESGNGLVDAYSWLSPGEIRYCNCGVFLVDPANPEPCDGCYSKERLGDFACGVCGKSADVMYVYGFRCTAHADIREPDATVYGDHLIIVGGVELAPPRPPRRGRVPTRIDHQTGVIAAVALAASRRQSGIPSMFWVLPGK